METENITYEPRHEISNDMVCATSKASDQPAHTRSLIRAFASRWNILWLLNYWLNIILSFYAYQEAAQARLSLVMSKYHIVGNHMSRLMCVMLVFNLDDQLSTGTGSSTELEDILTSQLYLFI